MTLRLKIRRASRSDARTLAEFNAAMALETEGKVLMPKVIGAGVRALLAQPRAGFYVIAETQGIVAGALMITTEWCDWRNGSYLRIQFVYVRSQLWGTWVDRWLYA